MPWILAAAVLHCHNSGEPKLDSYGASHLHTGLFKGILYNATACDYFMQTVMSHCCGQGRRRIKLGLRNIVNVKELTQDIDTTIKHTVKIRFASATIPAISCCC